MNNVQLIGRVGQDPKLMGDGKVARFSLATTERGYETKAGKKIEERTEWHTLVFFGNICKVIEQYVKTGSLISVKGSIHYSKWEDENQNVRYSTEIWCSDLELLGNKKTETEDVKQFKSSEEDLPF